MDYKVHFGTLLRLFNENEMIEVHLNNQIYRTTALQLIMEDKSLRARLVKKITRNFNNIVIYL